MTSDRLAVWLPDMHADFFCHANVLSAHILQMHGGPPLQQHTSLPKETTYERRLFPFTQQEQSLAPPATGTNGRSFDPAGNDFTDSAGPIESLQDVKRASAGWPSASSCSSFSSRPLRYHPVRHSQPSARSKSSQQPC